MEKSDLNWFDVVVILRKICIFFCYEGEKCSCTVLLFCLGNKMIYQKRIAL